MKKKLKIIIIIVSILLIAGYINGKKIVSFIMYNFYNLKPFSTSLQGKRVLIIAPHPDDAAISSAGLIQKVKKSGGEVYVLYLTYGDHNEIAFMLDEKKLITTPSLNRRMGEVRRREAENAMNFAGISESHLYFLGFPDNGTLKIWEFYWNDVKPYKAHSVNSDRVPYKDAYIPDAPFTGHSILQEVKSIISKIKPDIIIMPHPSDYNNDHRAAYLFTKLALLEIKNIKSPDIYLYLAHHRHWPVPLRYIPYFYLYPPLHLQHLYWERLELNYIEERNKRKMINFYRSQFRPKKYYLLSFVRQNELFGKLADLRLKNNKWLDITPQFPAYQKKRDNTKGMHLTIQGSCLILKVHLGKIPSLIKEFRIFLFGTKDGIPFEKMPKTILEYRLGRKTLIVNGKKIPSEDIVTTRKGYNLKISIPLRYLGNPNSFFIGIDEEFMKFSIFHFPWSYVEIENKEVSG